ncbi:hypothetical protein IVB30_14475 [Bradyrhizobium sp. 200]|uniref:hypothetical protein n=1 Tax=Bradyrhizobium sp. 200 TaxID=2782665 RepID=UPI002000095E|nr:hypothetical protein [Bradyrhizobium sp. 200]UPJ52440.1 hypothetical protein IVB30_14475 [Bradyrhizobium sp. 200]
MAARQDRQVEQGVGGEESGARDGRRPIPRPPCAGGQRQTGNEKRDTDVLNEMRVERAGVGHPGHGFVPEGAGYEHGQPVQNREYRKNCCQLTPHGSLLRPRRAKRPRCDGTSQRISEIRARKFLFRPGGELV